MQHRAGTGPVPAWSVALTVMSYMFTDVSYVLIMCFKISKIILMAALVSVFLYQILFSWTAWYKINKRCINIIVSHSCYICRFVEIFILFILHSAIWKLHTRLTMPVRYTIYISRAGDEIQNKNAASCWQLWITHNNGMIQMISIQSWHYSLCSRHNDQGWIKLRQGWAATQHNSQHDLPTNKHAWGADHEQYSQQNPLLCQRNTAKHSHHTHLLCRLLCVLLF